MSVLLDARNLVKHLGGRRVVDGVDLACESSQIVGLLGPNGAGKTTTLRMLYGFLHPDEGRIQVNGVELGRDLVRAKRSIGVCTQDDTFDGDFTVEQNLTIAATYFRPRPTDLARRVGELLDRFELGPYAGQKPETLSGGYRRRLMIARALVNARACSSSTSRRPASIPRRAWACGTSWTGCARRAWASSSPRTTWTRRSG
jgi:lipooligosaccharide transport system ATP-binding protein